MKSLTAIFSALFLALGAPALAAPLTFKTSDYRSSVTVTCGTPLLPVACNLSADIDFDDDDRRLDPSATFQFIEFEVEDEDEDEDDKRKSGDSGGNFFAIATLAFKINSNWFYATSEGTGAYESDDEEITLFSIRWNPIADLFIAGVGSLSIAFEDLTYNGDNRRRSRDDDEGDDLYLSATITAVPLPAGAVLLLSGIALLGAARLRRRAVA